MTIADRSEGSMDQAMTVEQARRWLGSYWQALRCGPLTARAIVILLADHARLVAEVERLQERIGWLCARQDEVREARGWREPRT